MVRGCENLVKFVENWQFSMVVTVRIRDGYLLRHVLRNQSICTFGKTKNSALMKVHLKLSSVTEESNTRMA
jgi:hypothetical protein